MSDAVRCSSCGTPLDADAAGGLCPTCLLRLGQAGESGETVALDGGSSAAAGGKDPPRFVGEFRIDRKLGSGGMGTVYAAYQQSMHRTVALKVLPPGLAFDSSGLQRFEREAWIAGNLNHPNIVRVYGQGTAGGTHFIAMELVEGDSLYGEIEKAREERKARRESDSKWRATYIRRIVEQFAAVADALHYVHERGIVHRDIKPMNLLHDRAGNRLLITDFGLARDEAASRMTRQGDFMGTVRYMSPEQLLANRAKVDHRSDIWSLGVSLYEALTLDLPYSAPTEEGYVAAVGMKDPVPARVRDTAVPRDLETVLMKCLERDPDLRYQSALDLKADLERYLAGVSVEARRPGVLLKTTRLIVRHWIAVAATTLVVMAAVGAAAWYVHQQRFYTAMESVLARLEEQGPEPRSRANNELTEPEKALRAAFVTGRLRADQGRRFAQLMISPRILASDYVDRKAPRHGIRVAAGDSPYRWGFIVVSKRSIGIGTRTLASDTGAQYNASLTIPDDALASLPGGRHRLQFQLTAWLFDSDQHDAVFGKTIKDKAGHSSRVGIVGYTHRNEATGKMVTYDGERTVPWEEYWQRMLKRTPPVWTGEVAASGEFQLVDDLPESFPLQASAPSLDATMQHAMSVSLFYLLPKRICYFLRIPDPLPAPLAGYLEWTTESGQFLARSSQNFPQGVSRGYSTCDDMTPQAAEWKPPEFTYDKDRMGHWMTKNADPRNLWYRIEHGERVVVVARFRAAREVARTIPGLNSYWNGTIEWRGVLHAYADDRNK